MYSDLAVCNLMCENISKKQESDCFRTVRLFPDTIFQVY